MYQAARTTSLLTVQRDEGSIVLSGRVVVAGIAVMEIVVTGNMSGTRVAVVGAIATDMQSVARRS